MTRCKFKCDSVTDLGVAKDVKLSVVTSGSEENKTFWQYSPSGALELRYMNPNVTFVPGKEYYLDISPA